MDGWTCNSLIHDISYKIAINLSPIFILTIWEIIYLIMNLFMIIAHQNKAYHVLYTQV